MTEPAQMDAFFAALRPQIEAATRAAFVEMVESHKDEGIYAFALYSDDGAMTVCPATNTRQFLARQPEPDAADYRFITSEWGYEGVGADAAFDAICDTVRERVLAIDEAVFDTFRRQLYDTCIEVLAALKADNFFARTLGEDIFLTFAVSDDGGPDIAEETRLVTRLNDGPWRDQYLEWMSQWK